jgi:hypothetical protein
MQSFFRWNFNFVKSKASVAILGPLKGLWKVQLFGQLQDNENFMKSTFICLLPIEAGLIFKTKKTRPLYLHFESWYASSKNDNFRWSRLYFPRRLYVGYKKKFSDNLEFRESYKPPATRIRCKGPTTLLRPYLLFKYIF